MNQQTIDMLTDMKLSAVASGVRRAVERFFF